MINIRKGSIDEVVEINETIPEFELHFSKKYFSNVLSNQDYLILVGEIDSHLAGFAICWKNVPNGWVERWTLGVNPNFRNMGLMKSLVQAQEIWAKKEGFNKIKSNVNNKMREMLIANIKLGYSITGVELHENIDRCRIFFEKTI